jgi:Flp pilus assembly pilin Flp
VQPKAKRKVVTMMEDSIRLNTESGQTMAEYAMVLGVITLVIVTTLSLLSSEINAAFNRTISIVTSAF